MDDRQIVAGVRLGDRDAVAALYDRYADVLHDYARRRVHSQADAADVVHDAFLVAVERMDQLRDPDRLRPWLYAIARTELHRRYRHAARYVELDPQDEWREPVSQEPGPDVQVERAELVALLREATDGLAEADRELLDLHLRHGLVGADLAAAAGLPARHASVALERVKGRLTRTLGVVLLSRQPACKEFAAIRAAQPSLTPLARKRLARHVDNCETCRAEQRRRLRPEVLLSAVPMLPAPPDLRTRLVASHGGEAPGGEVPGVQFWDGEGFPWPSRPRHRRWPAWIAAAAAVLLLIGGAVLVSRPLIAERAVAVESAPTPAPTAAPTIGAPAVPGAILTMTTAPPTTTSSTTTRTTTAPRTTTPTTTPPDTAPPDIGAAGLDPAAFSTVLATGAASCSTPPPWPIRAVVSTTVIDPSGVAAVTMTWSGPAGSSGSAAMGPGAGGGYTGTVGPVDGSNLAAGSYPLSVTVVARDNRGNETRRATTFGKAVTHCSPIG